MATLSAYVRAVRAGFALPWHGCARNDSVKEISMANADATAWEDQLIAEMRANDGQVRNGPLAGHPLLIMTNVGAKSGKEHRAILTWHRDAGDYVVAGTAGGSDVTPSWVHNVEANPEVSIEAENRVLGATARVIPEGPERDRLWEDHVKELPWFGDYPSKTDRLIPMVRLTPKAA
jgi:deazaflavin-dependent oxidoreductase (nitroreductase family)